MADLLYNDPMTIVWRDRTAYVSITQAITIVNGLAVLREIPDSFTKVSIPGYLEVTSAPTSATQFSVDYSTGILTFYSTEEGKTVNATYKGRGYIQLPAERILAHRTNPDVVQNLQDIIDSSQAGIDALQSVNAARDNANAAADAAKTAQTNAQTAADTLVHKGDYNAATAYVPRNVVNYDGSSYMNIVGCTGVLPTDNTKWKLVGSGLSWKGIWNSATAYIPTDVVSYQNSTFICKLANTNQTPVVGGTTYWDTMAEKGSLTNPIVDDSFTVRNSANNAIQVRLQIGTSGGLEFVMPS